MQRIVRHLLGLLASLRRKRGVLVYIGLHRGESFDQIFGSYEACYGFEANPELFEALVRKYRGHPRVHLVNAAVDERGGETEFHISSNDGASSSLGHFDDAWANYRKGDVRMVKTIRVRCVNLLDFCRQHGIDRIDDYVSDIQGMDLTVLKTMKPFIDQRRIGTITCEVAKDGRRNIYRDLPDNSASGFAELLEGNYELVAKGWGVLQDNQFVDVPDSWWEMDCKWRVRPGQAAPAPG
jgi:FkbM family methyltransferase